MTTWIVLRCNLKLAPLTKRIALFLPQPKCTPGITLLTVKQTKQTNTNTNVFHIQWDNEGADPLEPMYICLKVYEINIELVMQTIVGKKKKNGNP